MRTHYRNGDEIGLQHNGCDGCSPCCIDGVFCHETGCIYGWRDHLRACHLCGYDFYPAERGQSLCPDCIENTEEYFS